MSSVPEDSVSQAGGDEAYEENEVNEVEVAEIQGFVRQELEALATDLDQSAEEVSPEEMATLGEAALQARQFSEALEVIRDARGRIMGRAGGKSKGKGRGKTSGRPASSSRPTTATGKGKEFADRLR